MWMPTNSDVRSITYDIRFMISDNPEHPTCYSVTKINNTLPKGITKITVAQSMYNPITDNADLMIADYYKTPIEPEHHIPDAPVPDIVAKIDLSAWKTPKLVIGKEYREILGGFFQGDEEIHLLGVWEVDIAEEFKPLVSYDIDAADNCLRIKCEKDYSIVGQVITVTFHDVDNKYSTMQRIEVAAR